MTRPRIIIAGCSRRLRSHDASENSERHQPLIEKPLPQTSRFFPGRRGDYRLGWQCAGIPDRLRDHRDLGAVKKQLGQIYRINVVYMFQ